MPVLLAGPVQVCGRVWWPVSSWSVPWRPCSGSSTTLSRSTSACPAPLPPRCPSPWRRSWAWQSEAPPSRTPPPLHHRAAYSSYTGRLSINSSSAHGSFLYLCLQPLQQLLRLHVYILKNRMGCKWKRLPWFLPRVDNTVYSSVETPVSFYHFLSLGNWNYNNKSGKFPGYPLCRVTLTLFCTCIDDIDMSGSEVARRLKDGWAKASMFWIAHSHNGATRCASHTSERQHKEQTFKNKRETITMGIEK